MCKLADDIYGPCDGPMLRLNDSSKRNVTVYCERHARMVTAWVQTAGWRDVRPIFQWLKSLDADGLKKLDETMQTVILDSFIPYVPEPIPQTYQQSELMEVAQRGYQKAMKKYESRR